MPMQTHKRPGLRPAVESLIASCIPVLRNGGRLELARLVEAAAGRTFKPAVIEALKARGDLVFEQGKIGAIFVNTGPRLTIALRRFDLVIPPRISGQANVVEGGVEFRFDPSETFKATKFLLSVGVERLEVTSGSIVVNVQGGLFDQCIDLV